MHIILIVCIVLYVLYVVCKAFDKRDREIQAIENRRTQAICAAIRESAVAQMHEQHRLFKLKENNHG